MKYSDVYKDCRGCPITAYCGTVASSSKACNSYESSKAFFVKGDNNEQKNSDSSGA